MSARVSTKTASPALWLAGPVAFMVIFFVVPILQVAWQSVVGEAGGIDIAPYLKIFESGYYQKVIVYTMTMATKVTLICLTLGFPVAYFISSLKSSAARKIAIILMITPLFTSNIVRSFAWIMILGRNGVVNNGLQQASLISDPLPLLYSDFSVMIGLVYIMLPFMILSIYSALQTIDGAVTDAASDLGAAGLARFTTVIWPLCLPGVISGCVIVFALSTSAYVTPMVMSGGKIAVLSMLVYQQYAVVFDERVGAALSITLLALTFAGLGIGLVLAAALRKARQRKDTKKYGRMS